jgi:alkylation response protein AidB-like acyl-CoA dehydrogenase
MGQRGTKTCDVNLDNVRVPAAHIIGGQPGMGFKTAMKVLDRGRLHVSALSCGMADHAVEEEAGLLNAQGGWPKPQLIRLVRPVRGAIHFYENHACMHA